MSGTFKYEKLPPGMSFYKMGEGPQKVDLLPFILSKDFVPFIGGLDRPDDLCFYLNIYAHIFFDGKPLSFVCPNAMYGKDCPACASFRPKKRNMFLVWGHKDRMDERKGVQIWDVADYYIGSKIVAMYDQFLEEDNYLEYLYKVFDLDIDGLSLYFEKSGSGINTKVKNHKFVERKEKIPDWVLDQIISLDQAIDFNPTKEYMASVMRDQERNKAGQNPFSLGTPNPFSLDEDEKNDLPIIKWMKKKVREDKAQLEKDNECSDQRLIDF